MAWCRTFVEAKRVACGAAVHPPADWRSMTEQQQLGWIGQLRQEVDPREVADEEDLRG